MASNQADISRFGERSFAELVDQEHETIGIPSRSREAALKGGLAALLILSMAFIALPVVALFLKSPLDTTLRSLHDPDGAGCAQALSDDFHDYNHNCSSSLEPLSPMSMPGFTISAKSWSIP